MEPYHNAQLDQHCHRSEGPTNVQLSLSIQEVKRSNIPKELDKKPPSISFCCCFALH